MQIAAHTKHITSDVAGNGIYERVKARIIAHELPAGKRILVEPLADQLFVSNTPVREALIRLAAERVIKDVPRAGFFVKEISEVEIEGLYGLQQLLLDWSLSIIGNDERAPGILKPPNLFDKIDKAKEISPQTAMRIKHELFIHISMQSGNGDVIGLVRNVNDRTHYVRKNDYEIFGGAEHELLQLCQAYYQKDFEKLREDLRTYFHEKMDRLPDLLRVLRGSFLRPST